MGHSNPLLVLSIVSDIEAAGVYFNVFSYDMVLVDNRNPPLPADALRVILLFKVRSYLG